MLTCTHIFSPSTYKYIYIYILLILMQRVIQTSRTSRLHANSDTPRRFDGLLLLLLRRFLRVVPRSSSWWVALRVLGSGDVPSSPRDRPWFPHRWSHRWRPHLNYLLRLYHDCEVSVVKADAGDVGCYSSCAKKFHRESRYWFLGETTYDADDQTDCSELDCFLFGY